MELQIMSASQALMNEPQYSTYIIRIHNSVNSELTRRHLIESSNYTEIRNYIFDDIEPGYGQGLLFDDGLAQTILNEFKETGLACEALLVHCTRGKNRSPAVAMALNDVFKLGHDTKALEKQYSERNWFVYNILMKVAK